MNIALAQAPSNTPIQDLLERAGCRLRGRGRADCPKCEGHSRGTLSYTDETFFCHRIGCGWKGNLWTLSRELNVSVPAESVEQREARRRAKECEQWRDTCQRIVADRLRRLCRKADDPARVLAIYPDCKPAWNALQNLYDCESELRAALDLLSFEKASPWLETPMTHKILAAAFDEAMRLEKQSDAA